MDYFEKGQQSYHAEKYKEALEYFNKADNELGNSEHQKSIAILNFKGRIYRKWGGLQIDSLQDSIIMHKIALEYIEENSVERYGLEETCFFLGQGRHQRRIMRKVKLLAVMVQQLKETVFCYVSNVSIVNLCLIILNC